MKSTPFLCLMLLFVSFFSQAQDGLYQTYPLNGFVTNPALAGSQSSAQLLYGRIDMNSTESNGYWNASAEAKLGKIGLGFQGMHQRTSSPGGQEYLSTLLQGYFARTRAFQNGSSLQWGLVGGMTETQFDPPVSVLPNGRMVLTLGAGLLYRHKQTNFGISMPNVLAPSTSIGHQSFRPLFLSVERRFDLKDNHLTLGALYKSYGENMIFRGLDLNASLWIRSVVGLGISAQNLRSDSSGRRILWILQAKPTEHWQLSASLGRYWQITNELFYQMAVQYSWAK